MRCLTLLAAALSIMMWTAVARTDSAGHQPGPLLACSQPSAVSDDGPGAGDSDTQWHAVQATRVSITESVWKFSLVHAELAHTRYPTLFDDARSERAPRPAVRAPARYLRQTPLLI